MTELKKPISRDKVTESRKQIADPKSENYNVDKLGVNGDEIIEPDPIRVNSACEITRKGKNNQYIVMGRDRPAQRNTGYGSTGDTHANMIDIVVGMHSYDAEDDSYVDPHMLKDAARIYICQKTDIDKNFRLNGKQSRETAAIGMYADNIRVAAREHVKITSGHGKINSRGVQKGGVSFGIHLIANNRSSSLQPIPKGTNLAHALNRLTNHVHELNGIVERMLKEQDRFNKALKDHTHFSPFFGMMTSPSPECMLHGQLTVWQHLLITKTDLRLNRTNLTNFEQNYLKKGGKGYINSYYNKVN